MDKKTEIYQYLSQTTRNRIVFCHEEIPGLTFINVGKELSEAIAHEDLRSSMVSYAAEDALSSLLSRRYSDEIIGVYLALTNIGIFFESELGFNLRKMIASESINRTLIICSRGEITNNHYYFYTEGADASIDLTGLPCLVL